MQTRIWQKGTLLVLSTFTVLAGVTIAPVLDEIAGYFSGLENAVFWVQLVFVIPSIAIIISSFLVGKLLDRYGFRSVCCWTLLVFAMSGCYGFIATSLTGMLLSRFILGLSVAVLMIGVIKTIADLYEGPERAQMMGYTAAFGAFGGVLYTALATFLGLLDWRAPFLVYSLAVVLIPACAIVLPPAAALRQPLGWKVNSSNSLPAKAVARPRLWPFYSMALLEMFLLYTLPVHLAFYLASQGTGTVLAVGGSLSVVLLVLAVVSSLYRSLRRRWSAVALQASGFGILSLGFFCLIQVQSHPSFLPLALLLLGVGFGVIRPNLVMWTLEAVEPERRGAVSGNLVTCYFIGQFVCPFVLLQLNARPDAIYWLAMGLGSCATAVVFFYLLLGLKQRMSEVQSESQ